LDLSPSRLGLLMSLLSNLEVLWNHTNVTSSGADTRMNKSPVSFRVVRFGTSLKQAKQETKYNQDALCTTRHHDVVSSLQRETAQSVKDDDHWQSGRLQAISLLHVASQISDTGRYRSAIWQPMAQAMSCQTYNCSPFPVIIRVYTQCQDTALKTKRNLRR